MSNKPITAAEAFEAAGENLRQAEKAWSDTRVPDALLGRAIDIANAWTALGVGLSGVLQDWTASAMHDWNQETGWCKHPKCAAHQGQINALSECPVSPESLPRHWHSRPMCDHTWVRPMEPCANGCGARPEEGRSHLPCPKTCPDVTA